MNEYDFIRQVAARFRRAPNQRNVLFQCDAELLELDGKLWAFTLDDFSPEEDLFTSDRPLVLGANLVTATLSDLFAAGAAPAFFMQALCLPRNPDPAFTRDLLEGIRSALAEAGCSLCGGDMGTADPWRFCGFAMGPVASVRPVTHVLAPEPHSLWVTGTLGDANLAALSNAPTPRFELRMPEAAFIRAHGTGCIDTSGGLLDALWILHEQNPALRFEIDLDRVPLAGGIADLAAQRGFSKEAALVGGAGEYELLFATRLDQSREADAQSSRLDATKVGEVRPAGDAGVYFCRSGRIVSRMLEPPPCPRQAGCPEEHVRAVLATAARLFGRQDAP